MAVAKAVARFVRVSPRKARQVIDLIRNENVQKAQDTLLSIEKQAALPVYKALRSAIANAEKQKKLDQKDLYISRIEVSGGPMLKRYKAAAMGRATMIRRRMSHITVELEVKQGAPEVTEVKRQKARVKKPKLKLRTSAKGGSASGGKK